MSVTTLDNPITYRTLPHLADYELHHSRADEPAPSPNAHPNPLPASSSTPENWTTDYRRVPAYRPINTELDQSQRRVFTSGGERAFIAIMFTGVVTNAALSRIWHATGGRINDKIFHYKIGGEW